MYRGQGYNNRPGATHAILELEHACGQGSEASPLNVRPAERDRRMRRGCEVPCGGRGNALLQVRIGRYLCGWVDAVL